MEVFSLAPKGKPNLSSQVNNADDEQESRETPKNNATTSNQQDSSKSYCVYYPLGTNSICPDCPHLLGTSLTNIEEHLYSHAKYVIEFRCGVCNKLWPSWRSVITHYSKSSCRVTSNTPLSSTTCTQVSSDVIHPKRKSVEIESI